MPAPNVVGSFSHSFDHAGGVIVMTCNRSIDGRITVIATNPPDAPMEAVEAEREQLEALGLGVAPLMPVAQNAQIADAMFRTLDETDFVTSQGTSALLNRADGPPVFSTPAVPVTV